MLTVQKRCTLTNIQHHYTAFAPSRQEKTRFFGAGAAKYKKGAARRLRHSNAMSLLQIAQFFFAASGQIGVIQHGTGAQSHAVQRAFRHMHGDAGLVLDQGVQSAQQRTAA